MHMITVVIPARNEKFLGRTIQEIFEKARGEIQVIAVLDGYWPDPQIPDYPNLTLLHRGEARGMRRAITDAVALAKGEFIMKLDAHCMLDEGFDVKLAADCEENWVVVPRRKRLDADNWVIQDVGKIDVDYEYLSYPDNPADFGGPGLHGRKWDERSRERADKEEYMIDDLMSFQGSSWFMRKSYFEFLELMDEDSYGTFAHEAQEIGLKAWCSGGRVVVNKKTWYAHLHKGPKHGRGYQLRSADRVKGTEYTNKWIRNEAWHKQTLPFSFVIEKFWPVPGWTEENLAEIKQHDANLSRGR